MRLGFLESRRAREALPIGAEYQRIIYRSRYVQNTQVATRSGRSEAMDAARELTTLNASVMHSQIVDENAVALCESCTSNWNG